MTMHRSRRQTRHQTRGSAVMAALVMCIITGVVVASILGLAVAEKRANRASVLAMEARNTAESASEYVVAQVKNILQNKTDFSSVNFTTGDDKVTAPPGSYFVNTNLDLDSLEVAAGMESSGGNSNLIYLDPKSSQYRDNNYAGNYAYIRRVPVAARAAVSSAGVKSTARVAQYLEAYIMPLFTFAIFYNPDLEIFPGPDMIVNGPVHTNGNLFVRKQSSSGANLDFLYRVSVAGGLYSKRTNQLLLYRMRNGSTDTTNYTDNVRFTHPISGAKTALQGSSYWRDFQWDKTSESETTRKSFTDWADGAYSTNLRTRENGIEPLEINGANGAAGRSFIKPPEVGDDAGTKSMQIARKAGLIIAVNPDTQQRSTLLPNGTLVTLDPGAYRVFTQAGRELILPGQEYFGGSGVSARSTTAEDLPIKPATITTGGVNQTFANAVVRVADSGHASAPDFYDLRRVKNGETLSPSSSKPHTQRPIRKIDIDMTNLKKAVDYSINNQSSSTVYETAVPQASGDGAWANSIYNPSASPASKALSTAHAIHDADTGLPIASSSFWNGGIYVLSAGAEIKTTDGSGNPNRRDSGVRLINGRGRLPSKGSQGLTVATNDALYVLGHYNADGSISTDSGSASSRYPEDREAPCALMGDAITVLSQPTFQSVSGNYVQTRGWNDALSSLRIDTYSSYSTSWETIAHSNSNTIDGYNTSTRPGSLPTDSAPAASGTSYSGKLVPASTEISAAFLTGIVPSTTSNGAYSGGAHNFPRFLEDWYTNSSGTRATCAIRGSMVAFFASTVATEPWSLRIYQAPVRLWGLNADYIAGKLPPLTPNTIAMQQVNFRNLTEDEYTTVKSAIDTLPSP